MWLTQHFFPPAVLGGAQCPERWASLAFAHPLGWRVGGVRQRCLRLHSRLQLHSPVCRPALSPLSSSDSSPLLLLFKHTLSTLYSLDDIHFFSCTSSPQSKFSLEGKNSLVLFARRSFNCGVFLFALVPLCEMTSVWQALPPSASCGLRQSCCPGDDYFKF